MLTQSVSIVWVDDQILLYWNTTCLQIQPWTSIIWQTFMQMLSWISRNKTPALISWFKRKSNQMINRREEVAVEVERKFYQHHIKNKPLSIVMKNLKVGTKSESLFTRWNNSNRLLKCSRNTSASAVNRVALMNSAEYKCKLKLYSIKTLLRLMKFKQGYQSTYHVCSIMLQVNQVRAWTTWF